MVQDDLGVSKVIRRQKQTDTVVDDEPPEPFDIRCGSIEKKSQGGGIWPFPEGYGLGPYSCLMASGEKLSRRSEDNKTAVCCKYLY